MSAYRETIGTDYGSDHGQDEGAWVGTTQDDYPSVPSGVRAGDFRLSHNQGFWVEPFWKRNEVELKSIAEEEVDAPGRGVGKQTVARTGILEWQWGSIIT